MLRLLAHVLSLIPDAGLVSLCKNKVRLSKNKEPPYHPQQNHPTKGVRYYGKTAQLLFYQSS